MLLQTIVTAGILVMIHAADDWNYRKGEAGGPEYWKTLEKNCAGNGQSPLNIDTSDVRFDEKLFTDHFKFHGYDTTEGVKFRLGNNGHTVQIVVEGDKQYITGGALPGRYNTLQLHFHWGSHSGQGSEHAKNNEFYPMEMHVVHYYHIYNVSQALVSSDGLAVLGFFFTIMPDDNPAFEPLLSHFERVKYKKEEIYIPAFELDSLFPSSLDHFYRYKGSLTTPGCHESVFWTVFERPIGISEEQMKKFRNLRDGERPKQGETDKSHDMIDNFRPLQEANGRTIYTNMAWEDKHIGSGGARYGVVLTWFLVLLAISSVWNFAH